MLENDTNDPRIGLILNERYKIIERIGAGGMAVVYRGERIELGRPVAIKFLQEMMLQYPQFITRFESEAKAMSKLSHPYCVSVIDFGVEGAPYIVMDYVEGKTLKALLKEERLPVSRAVHLTRQILAGISHAHGHGIIHRDVKPENIMLTEATGVGETVRIFDFGLAKLLDAGPGMGVSSPSIVAGTPNYMAPEQSRGKKVTEQTDLYSIGVILFEMLTGQKPFAHEDFVEVVRMHRETIPPTLKETSESGGFSSGLEKVVAKALAKSPGERFQSADEFAEALNATREGSETKETAAPQPGAATSETLAIGKTFSEVPTTYMESGSLLLNIKRRFRKKKLLVLTTMVILLLAVLAFAFFGETMNGETEPSQSGGVSEGAKSAAAKEASRRAAEAKAAAKAATEAARAAEEAAKQLALTETREKEAPDDGTEAAEKRGGETALPTEVKSVEDVRKLIDAGQIDDAIKGLRKLRKENPNNPYLVLLLGNLYFQKEWWGDAIDYYREAIRMAPAYKTRTGMNKNLITALGSNKTYRKAASVIQNSIGRAALPHLRRASKRDKNPQIRKRAGYLIKKITK